MIGEGVRTSMAGKSAGRLGGRRKEEDRSKLKRFTTPARFDDRLLILELERLRSFRVH